MAMHNISEDFLFLWK